MRYLNASNEERSKLFFPEEWNLSQLDKLSGRSPQGRPSYEGDDVNRLYGDVWLLEQVVLKTGLRKDLLNVFDGNTELVE